MTPLVLIVEARFYPHISDSLLAGATAALEQAGARFDRITVPGALEIPAAIGIAAKFAGQNGKNYDGFVALGCVIRGETFHFEIVASESARALTDLGIGQGLCIGNGILTVENEDQALRRAAHNDGDKGGDAARACLALIRIKSDLNVRG
jgi:6,7-dimethyl-8-ribityllumazine synthase